MIMPRQNLSSGYEQPRLGLGTWDIRGREGVAALLQCRPEEADGWLWLEVVMDVLNHSVEKP